MHKFLVRLLLLLALLLSLVACGGKGNTVEVIRDGVRLELTTDQHIYEPGQLVVITATVENISSSPIRYTVYNGGDPPLAISVDTAPFAGRQCLQEKGFQGRLVVNAITSATLHPQQSIIRRVVWDQRIGTSPDPIPAPSGHYPIQVQFLVGEYSKYHRPQPLTLTLGIEIHGTDKIITAAQAYSAALQVADVRAWYDKHSGRNLVKEEGSSYYLLFDGDWLEISQPLCHEYLEYLPLSDVLMTEYTWEVQFLAQMGPPPHEICVRVDPATGRVLEWTSE